MPFKTNERLILEELSNLAMKLNETTNEIISRITDTVRVIKESFDWYWGKIPEPLNDINGGILDNAFLTFLKLHNAMMLNFFKINLFKAPLTPELKSVVAQQDQETMTIQKMYKVATTAQWESKNSKIVNKIKDIKENEFQPDPEDKENNIVAFDCQFNYQGGARPKTGGHSRNYQNTGRGGQQYQGGPISGNNANPNDKHCYYCKLQGHRQEECRKKIKENKPCCNTQGRLYWPSSGVYTMDYNSEPKSVNTISFDTKDTEENDYNSESRAAAQFFTSSNLGLH
jgi:hypothetical protein